MNNLRERVENLIHECWKSFNHKAGSQLLTISTKEAMHLQFSRLMNNSLDLVIFDKKELVEMELLSIHSAKEKRYSTDIMLQLHNGKESISIPIMLNCFAEGYSYLSELEFARQVYQSLETLEVMATLPRTLSGYLLLMTNSKNLIRNPNKETEWDISDGKEVYAPIKISVESNGKKEIITLKKDYSFEWHQHGAFWFSLVQSV